MLKELASEAESSSSSSIADLENIYTIGKALLKKPANELAAFRFMGVGFSSTALVLTDSIRIALRDYKLKRCLSQNLFMYYFVVTAINQNEGCLYNLMPTLLEEFLKKTELELVSNGRSEERHEECLDGTCNMYRFPCYSVKESDLIEDLTESDISGNPNAPSDSTNGNSSSSSSTGKPFFSEENK
jgi:hypothetical protein